MAIEPKLDIQGYLIYTAMVGYLISMLMIFIAAGMHYIYRPVVSIICKIARIVFFIAFLLSLVALVYRWNVVQHLPMQNMFEVFLFLGFCVWPIHIFSEKILNNNHPFQIVIDAAIGLIVLFPAGFVFNHHPQFLPPALQYWLFGPHVAAYMLSYIFMAKAAIFAVGGFFLLFAFNRELNKTVADSVYRLVAVGFPLLTLGLFLGSIWGKYAWGDWWGWDPKELWSLVCWLVYAMYLHARYAWPKQYWLHHILSILGFVCIIITLLWVNLSRLFQGLHNYAS